MIEMCAHHWSNTLQPAIQAKMARRFPFVSIDTYLGASRHEFTDHRSHNSHDYIFRIWFDDPVDELEFRLTYQVK